MSLKEPLDQYLIKQEVGRKETAPGHPCFPHGIRGPGWPLESCGRLGVAREQEAESIPNDVSSRVQNASTPTLLTLRLVRQETDSESVRTGVSAPRCLQLSLSLTLDHRPLSLRTGLGCLSPAFLMIN